MGMQRMAIYVIWFLLATCGAIRALGAGAATAWVAEDQVFYKIFVRSFADSNGDRIGDFLGIEQHLDYLHKLGVTSLLLTPIVASRFYHNYFASRFDGCMRPRTSKPARPDASTNASTRRRVGGTIGNPSDHCRAMNSSCTSWSVPR